MTKETVSMSFYEKLKELDELVSELFNEATYHNNDIYSDFVEIVVDAFEDFKDIHFGGKLND
jgi:hypothetical protein